MKTFNIFHQDDTVKVTGKHLVHNGQVGRITKWIHGDFYHVTLENDETAVLKGSEMEHIILLYDVPED